MCNIISSPLPPLNKVKNNILHTLTHSYIVKNPDSMPSHFALQEPLWVKLSFLYHLHNARSLVNYRYQ